jgi:hypothetical protein
MRPTEPAYLLVVVARPIFVYRHSMSSPHAPSSSEPNDAQSGKAPPVDLVAISKATGLSVDVLRTFSKISDPSNKHVFTAAAAQKAFSGVKF